MTVAFLLTSLVIVATPGTGALFTISAGLSRGARHGLIAAAGCTLGIVPHLVAAITGTAALLRASGLAFETVKFLGVGYLLYMAWATWRDKSSLTVDQDCRPTAPFRIIGTAIMVNLLNPKLTLFFFAFLPQFLPNGSPHQLAAMLGLSGVFMLMTLFMFSLYGVFAASVRRYVIGRPRVVICIRRLFAGSFAALGAKLATTPR
jgi:threonine/homoserine/homoserine lactone efflux protein